MVLSYAFLIFFSRVVNDWSSFLNSGISSDYKNSVVVFYFFFLIYISFLVQPDLDYRTNRESKHVRHFQCLSNSRLWNQTV